MQATSKGVFATVSDHARALVRHEQAICDLEANAYDSECEDDGGMVDDDYDDDDEDCDDDSDGAAPDCGGATQTGDGSALPARGDERDGPPPPTRRDDAGGSGGGDAPACSTAASAAPFCAATSDKHGTTPAVPAAAAPPVVACARFLHTATLAPVVVPSVFYAPHKTAPFISTLSPFTEALDVGCADCNFMNCTCPEGTTPPIVDTAASPHHVVRTPTPSPPFTGSLESTLPATPSPFLIDPLAPNAGPHAMPLARLLPLSLSTTTSCADLELQVASPPPLNLPAPRLTVLNVKHGPALLSNFADLALHASAPSSGSGAAPLVTGHSLHRLSAPANHADAASRPGANEGFCGSPEFSPIIAPVPESAAGCFASGLMTPADAPRDDTAWGDSSFTTCAPLEQRFAVLTFVGVCPNVLATASQVLPTVSCGPDG